MGQGREVSGTVSGKKSGSQHCAVKNQRISQTSDLKWKEFNALGVHSKYGGENTDLMINERRIPAQTPEMHFLLSYATEKQPFSRINFFLWLQVEN